MSTQPQTIVNPATTQVTATTAAADLSKDLARFATLTGLEAAKDAGLVWHKVCRNPVLYGFLILIILLLIVNIIISSRRNRCTASNPAGSQV